MRRTKKNMKVKDLKRLLKEYPDNAEVLIMKDWNGCPVSEEGNFIVDDEHLVEAKEEMNFVHQTVYIDEGLDWTEEHQLIIG